MKRHAILADHRRYSRARLEEGIFGKEYDARCNDMEIGSGLLLRALWSRHQRVMLVAQAHGRQVVQP